MVAQKIRRLSSRYVMVSGKLYKMGRSMPMLRYIFEDEVCLVLA